jgi:dolichol-phosphate mannosyltransferase
MRALVVVPTLDEIGNIEAVLRATRDAAPDIDVLVVDDDSQDGTADRADVLAAELAKVIVLRRSGSRGLGRAYCAGFAFGIECGYDVLVEMDCDLSHDPHAIPELLGAISRGADVAIGSRYTSGGRVVNWSLVRRGLSALGCWYARRALRLPVRDATSGFRAYRTEIVQAVGLETVQANGYAFQIEMIRRANLVGARIVEIPITFQDRAVGGSKMSLAIAVEALVFVTRWALLDRTYQSHPRPRAVHATSS